MEGPMGSKISRRMFRATAGFAFAATNEEKEKLPMLPGRVDGWACKLV